MDVEEKATEALDHVGCEYDQLKPTELTYLLHWHQIPPNEIGINDANYNK